LKSSTNEVRDTFTFKSIPEFEDESIEQQVFLQRRKSSLELAKAEIDLMTFEQIENEKNFVNITNSKMNEIGQASI
jgi:hypothetical protein